MGLLEIIFALMLVLIVWLFWQTRVLAEAAKQEIENYCDKYNLQMLAMARVKLQPSRGSTGQFCWKATYQFEFSSDGESYYLGSAIINGTMLISIETPAYRQS